MTFTWQYPLGHYLSSAPLSISNQKNQDNYQGNTKSIMNLRHILNDFVTLKSKTKYNKWRKEKSRTRMDNSGPGLLYAMDKDIFNWSTISLQDINSFSIILKYNERFIYKWKDGSVNNILCIIFSNYSPCQHKTNWKILINPSTGDKNMKYKTEFKVTGIIKKKKLVEI